MKKQLYLSAIILLFAFKGMAQIPLLGYIQPDSGGTYPTHWAIYGLGGWKEVADNTSRDAIPSARREAGMAVYVTGTGTLNILGSDLTTWTPFVAGSTLPSQTGNAGKYLQTDGTNYTWQPVASEVRQLYSSTSSVTISNGTTWFIYNPATLQGTVTITLPATPTDNQLEKISFGGTITGGNQVISNITIAPNTGQSIVQSSVPSGVMLSGDPVIVYQYVLSSTTWYRIN